MSKYVLAKEILKHHLRFPQETSIKRDGHLRLINLHDPTGYTDISVVSYRKTSSISRTKSQNLNFSCILLQLSSFSPLKPDVKLGMKI